MPRYTHLVISSGEASHLRLAQQARSRNFEVRTEAHCKTATEAELALRDCERLDGGRVFAVIELAEPIEY
jgi:hypothetical protein